MRKLVSYDKERLVSEGKQKNTHKWHKYNHLPAPQRDQCPNVLWMMDGYYESGKTISSSFCYPSLTVEHDIAQTGLFHLCNCTPHGWGQLSVCCALQPSGWTGHEEVGWKREPWCCASTAQQQAKGWHVIINTFSPSKQHHTGCYEGNYLHSTDQYRLLGIQTPAEARGRIALFWAAPE